ncbi:MAG TPA: hypothetical protein VD908_11380 [Cytophagales bacterium]|nr:hypothetical protein [Cytophagales bacterium]
MRRFYFLLALLCAISFMSCKEEDDGKTYQIKVDSLVISDVVNADEALTIQFFGTAGPDGCHSFSRFEVNVKAEVVSIKLWGKVAGNVCTQSIVPLNEKYVIHPPLSKQLTIIVNQPDGSFIERRVKVN